MAQNGKGKTTYVKNITLQTSKKCITGQKLHLQEYFKEYICTSERNTLLRMWSQRSPLTQQRFRFVYNDVCFLVLTINTRYLLSGVFAYISIY